MKRTENILIEDSDYELLQKVLPDSPCDSCDLGLACCGCPEERNYSEKVKPYKDSGVYEAALAVKRINTAGSKMEDFIMGNCKVFDCAIGAYMIAVDPCIESSLIEQDRYRVPAAGGNFE